MPFGALLSHHHHIPRREQSTFSLKESSSLRAFSSWKDQTKQEIGSDSGERELLLKEGESLLLTPHE